MITSEVRQLLDFYNEGLRLYKLKKWNEAAANFEKALTVLPSDGPSALYLERSREFLKNPPPDNWDGVFVMTTK